MFFNSRITAIGPEVAAMAEEGLVILFADGAPPELAEVSVQHKEVSPVSKAAPKAGARIRLGSATATITAIGPMAWDKAIDMGHIVFSFTGGDASDRPGEIVATKIDTATLLANLKTGAEISIG